MNKTPPSKNEILQRYRDKIAKDDFEILLVDAPPTPTESHQKAERIDILGTLGDWVVWTKRKLFGEDTGILVIFVTLIGVFQACEWLQPKIVRTCDKIASYLSTYVPYDGDTPSYYIAFEPPGTPLFTTEPPPVPDWVITGSQVFPISGKHPLVSGSS